MSPLPNVLPSASLRGWKVNQVRGDNLSFLPAIHENQSESEAGFAHRLVGDAAHHYGGVSVQAHGRVLQAGLRHAGSLLTRRGDDVTFVQDVAPGARPHKVVAD